MNLLLELIIITAVDQHCCLVVSIPALYSAVPSSNIEPWTGFIHRVPQSKCWKYLKIGLGSLSPQPINCLPVAVSVLGTTCLAVRLHSCLWGHMHVIVVQLHCPVLFGCCKPSKTVLIKYRRDGRFGGCGRSF
jgi:hypothetical protein